MSVTIVASKAGLHVIHGLKVNEIRAPKSKDPLPIICIRLGQQQQKKEKEESLENRPISYMVYIEDNDVT